MLTPLNIITSINQQHFPLSILDESFTTHKLADTNHRNALVRAMKTLILDTEYGNEPSHF